MSLPQRKPVLAGARRHLIEAVLTQVFEWQEWLGKPALDPRVLAAIAATPREVFLPRHLREMAHLDRTLEIEAGQRISQPSIVAVMTDLLDLRPHHRVLEIGTGCGYQTAILSRLVGAVYSVEVLPALAVGAVVRLQQLGLTNVAIRNGDGAEGWPAHAPFDRVILTAASSAVPRPLLEQLRPGGRLIAPVRSNRPEGQILTLFLKGRGGRVVEERIMPVRFVPMIQPGRFPEPATARSRLIVLPRARTRRG